MFSVAGQSVITFVIGHEFILFFSYRGAGTGVALWVVFWVS